MAVPMLCILCVWHSHAIVSCIYDPVCNLSASRKSLCRGGGLYAGSDFLSREYAPSFGAKPRCLHRDIYYRPIKLVRQSAFASLVLQKLDGQDQLTEIGPSVDGGVFQALHGFVLSMSCSIDTTVDAGFVLALPLHHRDLELDSVGVLTKDHVATFVLGWGGLFAR